MGTPALEVSLFNPIAYFTISPIAALLMFLIGVWALWKGWLGFFPVFALCIHGTGHTPFIFINFAKVAFVLNCMAALRAVVEWARRDRCSIPTSAGNYPWPTLPLIAVMLLILAKSGLDTYQLGLADYRVEAWSAICFGSLVPGTLLALAFLAQPWRKVIEDFMLGSVVVGGVWLLTGVLGFALYESLGAVLSGRVRMSLHNLDTINSVRLVPFVVLGLFWVIWEKQWIPLRITCLGGVLVCWFVILTTGTRQHALSCAALSLLFLVTIGRGGWASFMVIAGAIVLPLVILVSRLGGGALWARFQTAADEGDGRIPLWIDAWTSLQASPLTGCGFRNHGEFIRSYNSETGVLLETRDTVHGLYQEIFVDHGIPIGAIFTFLMLSLVFLSLRSALARGDPYERVAVVLLCVMPFSDLFSGTLTACGPTTLAVVMAICSQAGIEREKRAPTPHSGRFCSFPVKSDNQRGKRFGRLPRRSC